MKTPEGRTSALEYDGAIPLLVNSPEMTWSATTQEDKGQFMVPFNAVIQEMVVSVKGTATDTGARPLNVGTTTDTDKFVAAYDVDVATAEVLRFDGTNSAVFTSNSVNAGDIIEFGLNSGAAASGTIGVTLVLLPKEAE